jgi:hypothetical protein
MIEYDVEWNRIDGLFCGPMDDIHEQLIGLEKIVVDEITKALALKSEGKWTESDARLFLPLERYTLRCIVNLTPERAARLWLGELAAKVLEVEEKLKLQGNSNGINKTDAFTSVGAAFFHAGNLEHAYQFFAEAGREGERHGGSPRVSMMIGDGPTATLLRRTLEMWLEPLWQKDYLAITGKQFVIGELKGLLEWLGAGWSDAVQVIISLHRLAKAQKPFDNEASQHIRCRALADLILAIESNLRRLHPADQGELFNRIQRLLSANSVMSRQFGLMNNRFCNQYPNKEDRKTSTAVEWVINDCLTAFDAAPTTAEKAGIAAYLVVRLRNSVMHVIDESTCLYSDGAVVMRVSGLALSILRLSKHGTEGTLANI